MLSSASSGKAADKLTGRLSGRLSGLIGVIHLPPMPGDPRFARDSKSGGFGDAQSFALRDAEALVEGGIHALIIENFGSAPFPKGSPGSRLPPHQVAAMAVIARQCRERFSVPVGVNCLRNDIISALGIAAACDLAFVRVNVHTGAYVTDQGLIEGEADVSLRYRQQLGAENVLILADVLVKHAQPLAPVNPMTATHDTLHRGMADGVVVTGEATGAAVNRELLTSVRAAAGDALVLLGSGMTPEQADTLAPLANGAIIGTWIKHEGKVQNPVDVARVREIVAAVDGKFRVLKAF